jgi:predicted Co/Zn/Cd cation transporter (cation efflux family)
LLGAFGAFWTLLGTKLKFLHVYVMMVMAFFGCCGVVTTVSIADLIGKE